MTTTIIEIPRAPLINVLGKNGERWEKGWGTWDIEPPGVAKTCWRGAIRLCSPQPGDGYIVEQVEIRRGFGHKWNDAASTAWSDIDEHMNGGIEVTDEDLAATFGPQWEAIVALVRRAAVLTEGEAARLRATWNATWAAWAAWAACDACDAAVWGARATRDATRDAACDAAWAAVRDAVGDAVRAAAWNAAGDAAGALVARDLIGQHGFTQEHYDALTRPWREVIGPVHPDDALPGVTDTNEKEPQ